MTRWVVASCDRCELEARMRDEGLARKIARAWADLHRDLHAVAERVAA